MILQEISQQLQAGRARNVKALVQQALDEGIPAQQILNEGLLSGMAIIGEQFKNNEVFIPEVLVAARAMNTGVDLLKPHLLADGVKAKDYLYAINGQRITDSSTYAAVISSLKIGDEAELTLYRVEKNSAVEVKVEVTVVEYVPSGIFG